jgi:hypothetical protein
LFEFDPAGGVIMPAAGAGGLTVLAGVAWFEGAAGPAGVAAAGVAAAGAPAAVRTGGLGMYSGPVWPQADSRVARTKPAAGSANGDFTIRITV